MKKMLMLATTAAMIEQFNKNNIEILLELGYEVHVAGNFLEGNPISEQRLEEFRQWLKVRRAKWFHIPATRKPYDLKNNGKAYRMVVNLIEKYQYEFIHCHTPIGSVIGRTAAHKTHTKIIYTAHGFHFFKGAPLKNWLFYYPVERFLSRWTDILILINHEDYQRAEKSLHAKRTEYIPGIGVDLEKFHEGTTAGRKKKRMELGVGKTDILMLSVGELVENKNHASVIRVVAALRDLRIRYFICGCGEKEEELHKLIYKLGLETRVQLLGFRTDILELCQAADLFIFPSFREGLPVALMEAIACKVPVICSRIRGNTDLVTEDDYMFDPHSEEEIVKCIERALDEDSSECIEENYRNLQKCSMEKVLWKTKEIYLELT